jgi:hypothetical protein
MMALTTMCEIIDFLEPCKKGVWPHSLTDDKSRPGACEVSPAFAGGSELFRHLGGVGCALVDGLFALAVRSGRAVRHVGGSVAG